MNLVHISLLCLCEPSSSILFRKVDLSHPKAVIACCKGLGEFSWSRNRQRCRLQTELRAI